MSDNIAFTICYTAAEIDSDALLRRIIDCAYQNTQKTLQEKLTKSLSYYLSNQKKKKHRGLIKTEIIPEFSYQFSTILTKYTIINSPDLYFENLPQVLRNFMLSFFEPKIYGGNF